MSILDNVVVEAPWYNRLFEPAYLVKDAARYSGAHSAAVARWLRRGDLAWWDRARGLPLSYLELVEVAFATYFRSRGVPFGRIREARQDMARDLDSRHPFAEVKFRTDGYHFLVGYPQHEIGRRSMIRMLDSEQVSSRLFRVPTGAEGIAPAFDAPDAAATDSGVWSELIEEKSSEFDYEFGLVLTWHPAGRGSSVTIDPRMSFGDPSVSGVATWVIKGRREAGESLEFIQSDYGLPGRALEDALRFEGIDLESGR